MFTGVHQGRRYAPTRSGVTDDSPLNVQVLHVTLDPPDPPSGPGVTSPLPGAKMRISKANKGAAVVRAVRRHHSPQPVSLEAVWGPRGPPEAPTWPSPGAKAEAAGDVTGGQEEAPPRSRKKCFRPPDVRTIFTGQRDPRVKEESGEGHTFVRSAEGSWCDVCCDYVFEQGITCADCKYTCHAACRSGVSLDCHPAASPSSQDRLNNNVQLYDVEKEREVRTELSREEIRQKIEQYNAVTKDHLKMTLGATGVYTGFIKVQLDLRRPVTVRGVRGGAVVEEAFYPPRGATNTLHISSNNTVRQVIVALLNKFTVADNPAKYALYKRYRREEQVYVCKLAEGEQPLFLRLVAGPDGDKLSFVLREQQTGEVMWDAFSIPELCNFLRILEKEEQEQREAVIRRYNTYRRRLQEALLEVRALLEKSSPSNGTPAP